MSDSPSPTLAPSSGPPLSPSVPATPLEPKGPGEQVLKIVAAVATGIGILGFVTFVGGAILWVRVDEAGLAATEAISVIPSSVLVTTGATFLVPAVLTVMAVLVSIFLIYLISRLPKEAKERAGREKAKVLHQEAEAINRDTEAALRAAMAARAIYTSLSESLEKAKDTSAPATVSTLKDGVEAQRREAERLDQAAQAAASAAAAKKAKADNLLEASNIRLERSGKQFRVEMAAGALILVLVPLTFNRAPWHVSPKDSLILIVVLLAAAAISLFVYATTEKFIWFGVVTFLTVGTYLGLSTYISTSHNTKMQPAAALRIGHAPVTGAFIADTASNLYLGTFEKAGPPRMLVIPRAQVSELSIGPLLEPEEARKRALAMALEECSQTIEEPKTQTSAAIKKPACTDEQKQALSEAARQ
jgi:uncharacterized membrane protein YhiD involved in acid resistance